jgi:hypothetical protein
VENYYLKNQENQLDSHNYAKMGNYIMKGGKIKEN